MIKPFAVRLVHIEAVHSAAPYSVQRHSIMLLLRLGILSCASQIVTPALSSQLVLSNPSISLRAAQITFNELSQIQT